MRSPSAKSRSRVPALTLALFCGLLPSASEAQGVAEAAPTVFATAAQALKAERPAPPFLAVDSPEQVDSKGIGGRLKSKRPFVPDIAIGVARLAVFVFVDEATECRWCNRDHAGADTLNSFDSRIRSALVADGPDRRRRDTVSDYFLYLTPAAALSFSAGLSKGNRLTAFRMVGWALVANDAVTTGLKSAFARERPYVHFQDPSAEPSSPNGSFPSGHTSSTFASVAAFARACRLMKCRHEAWIWAAGVPAAAFTGYLRIAADKHYATDVMVGALVGGSIGWFVPSLFRSSLSTADSVAIQPVLGAGRVGVMVAWQP